jgi:hypothetical protein
MTQASFSSVLVGMRMVDGRVQEQDKLCYSVSLLWCISVCMLRVVCDVIAALAGHMAVGVMMLGSVVCEFGRLR